LDNLGAVDTVVIPARATLTHDLKRGSSTLVLDASWVIGFQQSAVVEVVCLGQLGRDSACELSIKTLLYEG
jgi:hypothetical protein